MLAALTSLAGIVRRMKLGALVALTVAVRAFPKRHFSVSARGDARPHLASRGADVHRDSLPPSTGHNPLNGVVLPVGPCLGVDLALGE